MQNKNGHPELFDYAPHLLRIDSLAKELHEACLDKKYGVVPQLADDLLVETRMLRAWAVFQMEGRHGN
jgi:hypothetical protein